MRIGAGEVGDPVAVEARHRPADRRLHRLVLENGGHPDGRGAQALDVVQLLDDPGQIAAVVEFRVGRIEAADQAVGGVAAMVVGRIAVGEAVRQQEVDDLVLRRTLAEIAFRSRSGQGRGGEAGDQQGQGRGGAGQAAPAA
ncbi:hypothetical protein D3C80_1755120 [compost metagenome]